MKWIDTCSMLADSLTKFETESGYLDLVDALTTGRWSTASSAEAVALKEHIRTQPKARAVVKKQTKATLVK